MGSVVPVKDDMTDDQIDGGNTNSDEHYGETNSERATKKVVLLIATRKVFSSLLEEFHKGKAIPVLLGDTRTDDVG